MSIRVSIMGAIMGAITVARPLIPGLKTVDTARIPVFRGSRIKTLAGPRVMDTGAG